jgi:hypothetical protein
MNLVEQINTKKNKYKENNDMRLKACLVEKWNEYMGANDDLMDQKKCLVDIEKEIQKIQNEFGLIFRQREVSAGKSKNKVEYNLQKHQELLENKLHVVSFKKKLRYLGNLGIGIFHANNDGDATIISLWNAFIS